MNTIIVLCRNMFESYANVHESPFSVSETSNHSCTFRTSGSLVNASRLVVPTPVACRHEDRGPLPVLQADVLVTQSQFSSDRSRSGFTLGNAEFGLPVELQLPSFKRPT